MIVIDVQATRPVRTARNNLVGRFVISTAGHLRKTKSGPISATSWFAMWRRCKTAAIAAGILRVFLGGCVFLSTTSATPERRLEAPAKTGPNVEFGANALRQ